MIQTEFSLYQHNSSYADTEHPTICPLLKSPTAQHPEQKSHNSAQVDMLATSRHHATNQLSPLTSNGTSSVSHHILLTSIDNTYSPRGQHHCASNDQHGTSSTWYSSLAKIPGNSLLRSQSNMLSQISGVNNKQRYQPYNHPVLLQHYTQNSDKLWPVNFNDSSMSCQTNASLAHVPQKCTPAEIHHPSHNHNPTSPSHVLVKANHYIPRLHNSFVDIPNCNHKSPPLKLHREDLHLPSLCLPYSYEATTPDSNNYYRCRHNGLLIQYQLPTLPTNSSFRLSRLALNFHGFSSDHLPWRSSSNDFTQENLWNRDHPDTRTTFQRLPDPISASPVHKTPLQCHDRFSTSVMSNISLRVTDNMQACDCDFTHHETLCNAYKNPNPPLHNNTCNDKAPKPSPSMRCTTASGSLSGGPNPNNSITIMANNTLARNGPHNEMQPNSSTCKPFSPDRPQSITNLPVSRPHMVGTSYSPPTSDNEDIDQLVEDKPWSAPVNAGYSQFQFMPGNTTSWTYKMVFYPGDKGPPSSPWNTCTIMYRWNLRIGWRCNNVFKLSWLLMYVYRY